MWMCLTNNVSLWSFTVRFEQLRSDLSGWSSVFFLLGGAGTPDKVAGCSPPPAHQPLSRWCRVGPRTPVGNGCVDPCLGCSLSVEDAFFTYALNRILPASLETLFYKLFPSRLSASPTPLAPGHSTLPGLISPRCLCYLPSQTFSQPYFCYLFIKYLFSIYMCACVHLCMCMSYMCSQGWRVTVSLTEQEQKKFESQWEVGRLDREGWKVNSRRRKAPNHSRGWCCSLPENDFSPSLFFQREKSVIFTTLSIRQIKITQTLQNCCYSSLLPVEHGPVVTD